MTQEKYLIVLGGATASGKTTIGIQLAKTLDTEILSADSRQFYKEMSIGTAKPTPEELAQVPHHFVDNISIEETYSVGDFEKDALKKLEEIFQEKNYALLIGGSGLYIKALCEGLDVFPEVSETIRSELQQAYQEKGIEYLQETIKIIDPLYAQKVDLQNPHRLIRAISVYKASGQAFSSFLEQEKTPRPFKVIYLCLTRNRVELYERINTRVDQMMEKGQLEEAKSLYPKKQFQALQTVGYQELFEAFDGTISMEDAIELIKRNSRRYAKRQGTWFRKDPRWFFFQPVQFPQVLNYLELIFKQEIFIQKILPTSPLFQSFSSSNKIHDFEEHDQFISCQKKDQLLAYIQVNPQKKINIIRTFQTFSDFEKQDLPQLLMAQFIHHFSDKNTIGFIPSQWVDLFLQHGFSKISDKKLTIAFQNKLKIIPADAQDLVLLKRESTSY